MFCDITVEKVCQLIYLINLPILKGIHVLNFFASQRTSELAGLCLLVPCLNQASVLLVHLQGHVAVEAKSKINSGLGTASCLHFL